MDTIGVRFDFPGEFESDSIVFEYRTSSASMKIDSIAVYVPADSVDHLPIADSLYWGDATDRNSTSWAHIALPWRMDFDPGEELRLKIFTNTTVADATIKCRYLAMKGRTYQSKGTYAE